MQLQTHAWEAPLLLRAYEARHTERAGPSSSFEPALLDRAYVYCENLTALHSKSFYLASGLLTGEKRRAVRALYAFCRVTDDLVDCRVPKRRARLETWRQCILDANPPAHNLVAIAWTDARLRYGIPVQYAEQLIDGVAQDLEPPHYETFDQLAAYSYGVASTVGLMSMHIIGYSSSEAIRYAIKLGVALQLTNILRDIAEDWQTGRLYLPHEELAAFGITPADLEARRVTPRWRAFMRFQIDRTRRLYAEAMPGIAYLHDDGRFAITAAAELYRAILADIERSRYDVFSRRAHIAGWEKLCRLPMIWWRSRRTAARAMPPHAIKRQTRV